MKWFGLAAWGPPCNGGEHVDPPIGTACIYCDERFVPGDLGGYLIAIMGTLDAAGDFQTVHEDEYAIHAECLIRQRYGSVRHQRGECGGDGSCQSLQTGMSRRQDAQLAAGYFLGRIEAIKMQRGRAIN